MTTYKHLNTGAIAELLSESDSGVQLKDLETAELKDVGHSTFRRWWKLVGENANATDCKLKNDADLAEEDLIVDMQDDDSANLDEKPNLQIPPELQNDPEGTQNVPDESVSENPGESIGEKGHAPTDEFDTPNEAADRLPNYGTPVSGDGSSADVADVSDTEPPMALSAIVAKLEGLFDLLNGLYFDAKLARPMITVQSTPKSYGHCSTRKIWSSGAENEGESYYEINTGAEFLNRPSEQTAATMAHEMVHLYCREIDLKETCQNGRYHNRLFKQECEKRDLQIKYDRAVGYSSTEPTDAFVCKLRESGFDLDVPFARHSLGIVKPRKARKPQKLYVCNECGQSVKSTNELNLICGDCDERMVISD